MYAPDNDLIQIPATDELRKGFAELTGLAFVASALPDYPRGLGCQSFRLCRVVFVSLSGNACEFLTPKALALLLASSTSQVNSTCTRWTSTLKNL